MPTAELYAAVAPLLRRSRRKATDFLQQTEKQHGLCPSAAKMRTIKRFKYTDIRKIEIIFKSTKQECQHHQNYYRILEVVGRVRTKFLVRQLPWTTRFVMLPMRAERVKINIMELDVTVRKRNSFLSGGREEMYRLPWRQFALPLSRTSWELTSCWKPDSEI